MLIIAEDVDGEALATLVVNKLQGTDLGPRGQGAGLRRPPQGDAPRHRDPDRRHRDLRGDRAQARLASRSRTSARPAASSPPRTTRRSSTATGSAEQIKARMTPDQGADRGHHLGLRQGEAPGAPRQAGRRRRRHQGRRGHRGRAQGEEAPHRGCALDDPCGRRGGPRRRRRHHAPPGHPGARQAQARRRRAGRRRHRPQGARGPGPPDRRQRRRVRRGRRRARSAASRPARATTPSSGEYGDMFKKGIVDAAKVTRSALQNAASIAAMVLTTETLVTDIPEKEQGRRRRRPRPRRRHGLLVRPRPLATPRAPEAPPPGLSIRRSGRRGLAPRVHDTGPHGANASPNASHGSACSAIPGEF